ncbi:MAG: transcription-repair coupling factor (superfamily II helicase) [Bacteroidetes bacterium]|nr:MAG: transcription-repair coupling factor (superfamily II helicase) [Bacteroidota bacterium]
MSQFSLKSVFHSHPVLKQAHEALHNENHILLQGLSGSSKSGYLSALSEIIGGQHLVVCSDKESAAYFYNDIESLFDERNVDFNKKQVLFYPTSYKKPYEPEKPDNTYILSRAEVLGRWSVSERKTIVVTYPEALCEKVVTRNYLNRNTLKLKVTERVSLDFIADVLSEYNFERVDFVVEPGQFSIRGGLLDVFSFSNDYPYRIEFFGEEVESIRSFDPVTQLSVQPLQRINLLPNIQDRSIETLRQSFLEYIPKATIIWIDEAIALEDRIAAEWEKAQMIFEKMGDERAAVQPDILFAKAPELIDELSKLRTIEFGQKSIFNAGFVARFDTQVQTSFNKNFKLLLEDLLQKQSKGYQVYMLSDNAKQMERLFAIFDDLLPSGKNKEKPLFQPVYHSLHAGFTDQELKVAVYTDHQIFERYHKFHLREGFAGKEALSISELYDLKPGDYVSHIDHGIGRFDGLEIIDNNGKHQEAIRLIYKNDDILYVSIHSLHRIAKFSGKDGAEPVLNKLGSNAWNKLKNKTKSRVKDIARDLIKLYAKRKASKGFQFMPDTYLQNELEASFIYEDTPDQIKSTIDVKADMESEAPMDRLVCGDVGFGKTEIAIRAAFKAVNDSKQVAVLVPTTILALQHYKTFSTRLADFPVKVDYINRFKSAAQQKETLDQLLAGKIDILIGTHRIISKDVQFKDLGLLVIDEEQKFGVSAKEKLKQIKSNVDTLTLTATPIPRTLQFSMMGARDLSIINTPPPNRFPVQTELRSFNEEVIKEALLFEVARGGQAFFVHNRVQNIMDVYDMLLRFVPGLRIGIAHGQMDGDRLEKVMMTFIEGDYDVLLATTIIESGLDIPNANTIIINDAHHYGLSDLHQLRGRVGRSNKKAFCYLLAPPMATLTSEAQKRLRAIEDFSGLGSGFNIAMRDLDIRGAGNLLGGEQSGFISDIGYEMFHKILDEAIQELKESEFADVFKLDKPKHFVRDCVIESDMEILMPPQYVDASSKRISLYNELDNIQTEELLQKFTERLIDQFGPVPREANDLINTIRLRWIARDLGFEKIVLRNKTLIGYFVSDQQSAFYQTSVFTNILKFLQANPKSCRIKESNEKLMMYISAVSSVNQALSTLLQMKQFEG